MAKTIEELKQMIDSVIVENGKGQITGQGLNLVLNEMSDALSEMGGGGGGGSIYQIYVPLLSELTEEEKAFNAEQHAIIVNKIQNSEIAFIGVTMTYTTTGCQLFNAIQYLESDGEKIIILDAGNDTMLYFLQSGDVVFEL